MLAETERLGNWAAEVEMHSLWTMQWTNPDIYTEYVALNMEEMGLLIYCPSSFYTL